MSQPLESESPFHTQFPPDRLGSHSPSIAPSSLPAQWLPTTGIHEEAGVDIPAVFCDFWKVSHGAKLGALPCLIVDIQAIDDTNNSSSWDPTPSETDKLTPLQRLVRSALDGDDKAQLLSLSETEAQLALDEMWMVRFAISPR